MLIYRLTIFSMFWFMYLEDVQSLEIVNDSSGCFCGFFHWFGGL